MIKIVIPDEKPKSWNQFYSGKIHWRKRNEYVKGIHQLVRAYIDPDWPMFSVPVDIHFKAYLKGKPIDASNLCVKPYEDGLIGWLIEDDSPEFVKRLIVESLIDKEEPRVEIYIYESPTKN